MQYRDGYYKARMGSRKDQHYRFKNVLMETCLEAVRNATIGGGGGTNLILQPSTYITKFYHDYNV